MIKHSYKKIKGLMLPLCRHIEFVDSKLPQWNRYYSGNEKLITGIVSILFSICGMFLSDNVIKTWESYLLICNNEEKYKNLLHLFRIHVKIYGNSFKKIDCFYLQMPLKWYNSYIEYFKRCLML